MMKRVLSIFAAVLTLALSVAAHASPYQVTFTLNPVAGVSGRPGETVGWGLTIVNNETTNWIFINSASTFTPLSGPPLGDYLDFSLNSDPVGPGGILNLPFDLLLSTGAGKFDISGTAPYDQTSAGYITFSYDVYDGDPAGTGAIFDSGSADVNASVSTPEPSTYALLCLSLGVVGCVRRKMKKSER